MIAPFFVDIDFGSVIINTDNTVNTDMIGDGIMIFNNTGNVFEQIANNYIKMIETGVIKEGEYLPSCRDLAKDLGINPNTAQRAYTLLEEKGYVTKVLKKGVYVSYSNKNNPINEFKLDVKKYKDMGITKDDLLSAIDTVYGGDTDDKN